MHNNKTKKFNFILLEAIDEALNALGESVKKSVYFHLETSYNIQRYEIPNKTADFSDALDKMFGLGARYLEILIIKKFYPKIQVTCNWSGPEFIIPDLAFEEYIELMRKQFCKQAEKAKMEFFIDDCRNKEHIAELQTGRLLEIICEQLKILRRVVSYHGLPLFDYYSLNQLVKIRLYW